MVSEIKDFEQRKENLIKKGKELGFITYEELAEEGISVLIRQECLCYNETN